MSAVVRSANSVASVPDWAWEPFAVQVSKAITSLNLLCMMNNFMGNEDAADALEQLQEEEDNDNFFNEGLTLGKLAFVLPVIQRVFTDNKLSDGLRAECTKFLKNAFSVDFLTVSGFLRLLPYRRKRRAGHRWKF